MNKYLIAWALGAVPALALSAEPAGLAGPANPATLARPSDKNPADLYFSTANPALTPQEKAALAIAQKWRNSSGTGLKPVAGADGSIRFLFGAQQPSIVCAVLQVCDVEL